MKGLLIKDIGYMTLSKRLYGIMLLMVIMVLLVRGGGSSDESMMSFMSTYIGIVFGIQVLTTISLDEMNGGLAYILAMPVNRKMYVYSKYLYALFSTIAGVLIGFAVSLVFAAFGPKGLSEIECTDAMLGMLAVIGITAIIEVVMIPIQFKFGSDNGKIVLFIIVAFTILGTFAAKRIGEEIGIDNPVDTLIGRVAEISNTIGIAGIIAAGIAIVGILMWISIVISNRIVEGKEF